MNTKNAEPSVQRSAGNARPRNIAGGKKCLARCLRWLPVCLIAACLSMASCMDDEDVKNYYTFTGEMVTDFLEHRADTYSDFITVLQRAKVYDLLHGYGKYTCFAPTNEAFNTYLKEHGYATLADIPDDVCDTIAWTHVIKDGAFFTTDLEDGSIPAKNMDGRYLVISSDSDTQNNNKLIYYINKTSRLVNYDDSVENGVVHPVNRLISASNLYLPDMMEKDSTISLFTQALVLTHLDDSLMAYIDPNYECTDKDSTEVGVSYKWVSGGPYTALYAKIRKFGFTAFVEPNSVYAAAGITTLDQLKAYAKSIYDATYPEDAGKYDNDFTSRHNPLNRFVAYHLLDRMGNYNDWNITGTLKTSCCVTSLRDVQDFYETLCPHTLIKICSPSPGMFINRAGLGTSYTVRGCRVLSPSESHIDQSALNGVYHYIDRILTYDTQTRDQVLNTRFRFDATTLSPDFMTCGARGMAESGTFTYGFKNNAVKNFSFNPETRLFCTARHYYWSSWEGDDLMILGLYDVTIKLPPVPEGTYEVRLGYVAGHRGTIQVYFDNVPCGIPLEMSSYSKPGSVDDTGDAETDNANDKAMHNRGYLKAPDSYLVGGAAQSMRKAGYIYRRILTTEHFDNTTDHYLRVRLVLDDPQADWSFDYLELCPKTVYDAETGEDTH
jgi:uncharacterized surface protein with fasciclin (FAS1) repeats